MTLRTKITPLGRRNKPYKKNSLVFENGIPGTYTLQIKKGIFELQICGAGGGGGGSATSHSWYGSNGGAAAAFKGQVKFSKTTLTITIGKGGAGGYASGRNAAAGQNGTPTKIYENSTNIITTGAGNGGSGTGNGSGANNGNGGILTLGNLTIIKSEIQTNGAAKSTVSPLGNSWGAGGAYRGSSAGLNGQDGYIKITFIK